MSSSRQSSPVMQGGPQGSSSVYRSGSNSHVSVPGLGTTSLPPQPGTPRMGSSIPKKHNSLLLNNNNNNSNMNLNSNNTSTMGGGGPILPTGRERSASHSQPQSTHSHSHHHHSPPNLGASPTVPDPVKGVCPVGLPTSEAYTVQCSTECLKKYIVPGMWLDEMAVITNGRAIGETIRLCGASSVYIRFKENKTGYPLAFSLPKHVLVPYSTTACNHANMLTKQLSQSHIGGDTPFGGHSTQNNNQHHHHHHNTGGSSHHHRHDSLSGEPSSLSHNHNNNNNTARIGVSPTSAFASSHDMQTMLLSHSINHHNRREGVGSLSPVPNLNGTGIGGSSTGGNNGMMTGGMMGGGGKKGFPLAASAESLNRADGASSDGSNGSHSATTTVTPPPKCQHYAAMHASKDHHDHVEVHHGDEGTGPLLCVVCGCWGCPIKKPGQHRASGYKCHACVGKASLPRLRSEFQRLLKQSKVECST